MVSLRLLRVQVLLLLSGCVNVHVEFLDGINQENSAYIHVVSNKIPDLDGLWLR
jgi:hypothetical protein